MELVGEEDFECIELEKVLAFDGRRASNKLTMGLIHRIQPNQSGIWVI